MFLTFLIFVTSASVFTGEAVEELSANLPNVPGAPILTKNSAEVTIVPESLTDSKNNTKVNINNLVNNSSLQNSTALENNNIVPKTVENVLNNTVNKTGNNESYTLADPKDTANNTLNAEKGNENNKTVNKITPDNKENNTTEQIAKSNTNPALNQTSTATNETVNLITSTADHGVSEGSAGNNTGQGITTLTASNNTGLNATFSVQGNDSVANVLNNGTMTLNLNPPIKQNTTANGPQPVVNSGVPIWKVTFITAAVMALGCGVALLAHRLAARARAEPREDYEVQYLVIRNSDD